jgi:hypothetical protein
VARNRRRISAQAKTAPEQKLCIGCPGGLSPRNRPQRANVDSLADRSAGKSPLKGPKAPDLHLKPFRCLAERPPFGDHTQSKVQTFLQSQKPPEKLTFTRICSSPEISRADYLRFLGNVINSTLHRKFLWHYSKSNERPMAVNGATKKKNHL